MSGNQRGSGRGIAVLVTVLFLLAISACAVQKKPSPTRDLDDDTLTVVRGLEGSYPNFFLVVDQQDLPDFAERYATIRTRVDYERFVGRYGIRRTNSRFWPTADWFHHRFARDEPVLAGLFDLNRYHNR